MPAKFNILVAASIPLVPLIPLLACGGSSATPDAKIHVVDSPNGSGSGSGSGHCSVASSLGTPTFSGQGAQYAAGSAADATDTLIWQGALSGANMQAVEVLIFGNCGTNGSGCGGSNAATPDWPTTFGPKSGLNLMTVPDALVAVLANYNSSTMKFGDIYISTAGTLNVTAASNTVGQNFSGNASNVTVQHYDFGSAGVMPDPDNCMSSITSFSFTGSAAAGFDGKVIVLDGTDREAALRNYLSHRYQ